MLALIWRLAIKGTSIPDHSAKSACQHEANNNRVVTTMRDAVETGMADAHPQAEDAGPARGVVRHQPTIATGFCRKWLVPTADDILWIPTLHFLKRI